MGDRPARPEPLLAEVVRDADRQGRVWQCRPFDRLVAAPERAQVRDHRSGVRRLVGVSDDDLEGVSRQVAEQDGAARAPDHVDRRPVEGRQVAGVDALHREQLRGDRALVLRARPGDPLSGDAQAVRQRAREVVGVPVLELGPEDQVRVGAGVGVDGLGLEGLQLRHPEVRGRDSQAAAHAVGVADVVLHADRALEWVGGTHRCSVCSPAGLRVGVRASTAHS